MPEPHPRRQERRLMNEPRTAAREERVSDGGAGRRGDDLKSAKQACVARCCSLLRGAPGLHVSCELGNRASLSGLRLPGSTRLTPGPGDRQLPPFGRLLGPTPGEGGAGAPSLQMKSRSSKSTETQLQGRCKVTLL
ncbi:hypothetical protein EYF80_012209 [Liparis tanakae]|uniref:Uncharacterized protein n=1 Tax=Liparis tanakae TaxID=230148 RepID=A0A4Z2IHX8_9TELE|nr:hypothetical protein EYF80_012209 [Liparis tanakae]